MPSWDEVMTHDYKGCTYPLCYLCGRASYAGKPIDPVAKNFEATDRAYQAHPLRFTETRTLWNTATLEEKEWWLRWIR